MSAVWPDPAFAGEPFGDPPQELEAPSPRGLVPERAELPVAERLLTEAELVRLACDHAPHLVAEGGDRLLGPWADEAGEPALRAAVALAAFLVGEDADVSPVDRFLRECEDPRVKAGARAARAAPLAPYAVERHSDGTATVTPRLAQGRSAPDGPVPWRDLPTVGAGGDGSRVFARIARSTEGFRLVTGVVVPAFSAGLDAWVAELALSCPGGTTEDLLRRHGHVLLRRALLEAW